ncbi:hypothetical protein UFOVP1305_6 [uncultured Caudovirales phage]|uniref:Uncharacterized protein n=1 Tax=uncultured Caudovirales phage TaxID=2100421 RepID=A0A6J5PEM9_9CAUD|nr:hypothetical protein UFOVP896_44 [uncultured Caudovirales phage]CAB4197308.1 hypothetical protein UFOVP1305_6 [uncultured Caudovirales phage]
MNLTSASLKLFTDQVRECRNYGGEAPQRDSSKATAGNLMDLKKKGLITTDDDGEVLWVEITEAGKAYAAELGI